MTLIGFKEKNVHLIYSPSLDLTGYGNTEEEAKASFHTVFQEFINYTAKKKTLAKELTRLGWTIKGGAKHQRFKQPNFADLLINNKDLHSLVGNKDYRKFSNKVEMPV